MNYKAINFELPTINSLNKSRKTTFMFTTDVRAQFKCISTEADI